MEDNDTLSATSRCLIETARLSEGPSSTQRARGRQVVLAAIAAGGVVGSAATSQAAQIVTGTKGVTSAVGANGVVAGSASKVVVGLGVKGVVGKLGLVVCLLGAGYGVVRWQGLLSPEAGAPAQASSRALTPAPMTKAPTPLATTPDLEPSPVLALATQAPAIAPSPATARDLEPSPVAVLALAPPIAPSPATAPDLEPVATDLAPGLDPASPLTALPVPAPAPALSEPSSQDVKGEKDPLEAKSEISGAVPSKVGRLSAELAMIRSAKEKLQRHRPTEALVWIDKARTEYRDGSFAQERELLRVQALCQLGRGSDAVVFAQKFSRRWPSSPWNDQLLRFCTDD